MDPDQRLPDLVHDSKIETTLSGGRTEHIFYEPGRSPRERRKRRVETWSRDGVLGRGAYGIVYRERREGGTWPSVRAVKEISKCVADGEQLDYIRELEAIMKFSHHNYSHCFVRSSGWFDVGETIFIIMEYFELGDLQKYLQRPLPEFQARQIANQVLEGLQFMHNNGFIHRDLKPANLMVVEKGPDWYVKIADFGISKRRQQESTTLLTMQRGTLGFAAPEVLGVNTGDGAASYGYAADIWSLAAVVYCILTSTTVFANAVDTIMYAMGSTPFPVAVLHKNKVSEQAISFITSLLAPTPGARPVASIAATHQWFECRLSESAGSTAGSAVVGNEQENTLREDSLPSAKWSDANLSAVWSDKTAMMISTTQNQPRDHPSDDMRPFTAIHAAHSRAGTSQNRLRATGSGGTNPTQGEHEQSGRARDGLEENSSTEIVNHAVREPSLATSADFKDSFPFESRPDALNSNMNPFAVGDGQGTDHRRSAMVFPALPTPPAEPMDPWRRYSWERYRLGFQDYLRSWIAFDATVIDYFVTRDSLLSKSWAQEGYVVLQEPNYERFFSYVSSVNQDNKIRTEWIVGHDNHRLDLRSFFKLAAAHNKGFFGMLPDPEHLAMPSPPAKPPVFAWLKYILLVVRQNPDSLTWAWCKELFKSYLQEWHTYNGRIVDHFNTRKRQVIESKFEILDMDMEYYCRVVATDDEIRLKWDQACKTHAAYLHEFRAYIAAD